MCTAVLMSGISVTAERRRRIKLLGMLSEFFFTLGQSIKNGGKSFPDSLAEAKERVCAAAFSFPGETLKKCASGAELAETWRSAVLHDAAVGRTGAENAAAICSLADFFADISPSSVASACEKLGARFGKEKMKSASEFEKNERLYLTGSLLGAAAVFIIMI